MAPTRQSVLQTVLFYLISFALITFAIGVVTARSAVYGVLCLVSAMCMIAGLFILLKAYLVATVLVLVYAGAILVLFLFVVMLTDFRKISLDWQPFKLPSIAAIVLVILLFGVFYKVIQKVSLPETVPLDGTTEAVGMLLFSRQVLPFELTSFLLLAAVVSVVALAKKDAS
jgi:NADH-quinone oxidoreductase subunit J